MSSPGPLSVFSMLHAVYTVTDWGNQGMKLYTHGFIKTYCSIILYVLMQSESNVQKILISDPKDGVTSYGLTEEGKKQAKQVHVSDNHIDILCIVQ